jgi:lambda repressor-like predicted transcriptional regulator
VDVDDIIARYRQGASMLTLANQHHTSRHTIRRILNAADEPTRASGRPRLDVSSETIAELYEAGTSFQEISTRLGIHPDAARTRYNEIRSQRGLTRRGPWHQVLLDALDQQPMIAVLPTAADHLGRHPTRNEAHAVRRAARDLARAGDATLDHQLLAWQNRRCPYLVLTTVETTPPPTDNANPSQPSTLTE